MEQHSEKSLRDAFIEALKKDDDAAAITLLKQHGLGQLAPLDNGDDSLEESYPPMHLATEHGRVAVFDALVAAGRSIRAWHELFGTDLGCTLCYVCCVCCAGHPNSSPQLQPLSAFVNPSRR